MDILPLLSGILGLLGIGAIISTLLDKFLQSNLEKQKILYDKRYEVYSSFCEFVLSLNTGKHRKSLLEALAESAKVRMLVSSRDLEVKIDDYIHEMNEYEQMQKIYNQETNSAEKEKLQNKSLGKFEEIDSLATEITNDLKDELNSTFQNNGPFVVFLKKYRLHISILAILAFAGLIYFSYQYQNTKEQCLSHIEFDVKKDAYYINHIDNGTTTLKSFKTNDEALSWCTVIEPKLR